MLVSEAITQVRRFLDEEDAAGDGTDRYSDAEIRSHLSTALDQIATEAVAKGINIFHQILTLTIGTDGYVAVPEYLRIISVARVSGRSRTRLEPGNRSYARQLGGLSGSLEVVLVPRFNFPASNSSTIEYGSSDVPSAVTDEYLCALAASSALIKTGQVNPALEMRKSDLRRIFFSTPSGANAFVAVNDEHFTSGNWLYGYPIEPHRWAPESNTSIRVFL